MNLKPVFPVGALKFAVLVMASVLMASCSGGGTASQPSTASIFSARNSAGQLLTPPTTTGNTLPIVIDAGPVPNAGQINVAYVSVTVCTPGASPTTAACQTINHVALDTGSTGLRLLNSSFYSNLYLPAVTNTSGEAIGECSPFVIGTTWGSVRYADVYLGGEVARNVPIQDIGDTPGGATAVPGDCANYGVFQDTQSQLGANGMLGIGPFQNDCDACLAQPVPAAYYTCNASGCTNSTVTSTQVVQNPVSLFELNSVTSAEDNNGVLIDLPAVSSANDTNPCTNATPCSLIFGIGTATNNTLNGATVYATDPSTGNFTTTFNGQLLASYIDSGSNALFFNDSSLTPCPSPNDWVYCPLSTQTLAATNTAASGGASGAVNFSIVNADQLFSNTNVVAGNIGGPGTAGQFAWGLPFFFGRPVFTAISGASTPGGTGPYFAY